MKRVVQFKEGESKNQQRFELLCSAVIIGGSTPSRGHGIDVIRKEAKILDALDAISVADDHGKKLPNGDAARTLTGRDLVLAQPEHELLKKRIEDAPWNPSSAREVVDCVDWFGAAQEQQD